MPRVLCLHGRGTSSKIFETQLLGIRRSLPSNYDLVFADGEAECDRASELPPATPGPFLSYFNGISLEDVIAAHDLLQAIIDEEGPFDGVFAFSEGAGLALSYLLELERQHFNVERPFKFAILFSPIVPLSSDYTFSADIIQRFVKQDFDSLAHKVNGAIQAQQNPNHPCRPEPDPFFTQKELCWYQEDPTTRYRVLVSSLGGMLRTGVRKRLLDAELFAEHVQNRNYVPRIFHPALLRERIQIPMVYVTGSMDDSDLLSQFKVLPFLCKQGMANSVVHSGAHDLPHTQREIEDTVAAIGWAVEDGDMLRF